MKLLVEKSGYIIFQNIDNDKILYEKLFSTFHNATSEYIDPIIRTLNKIDASVTFHGKSFEEFERSSIDSLILNITENCNNRCSYCAYSGLYLSERNHSESRMNYDIAEKAIDYYLINMSQNGSVGFYGGEPLLEGNLLKKIVPSIKMKTKNRNIEFAITTNFTQAGFFIDFFAEHNIILTISLDGPSHIHDKWRKNIYGEGTFNKIYNNILELSSRYPDYYKKNVAFNVVVTNPNNLIEIDHFFSQPLFEGNSISVQSLDRHLLQPNPLKELNNIELGPNQIEILAKKYIKNIISKRNNSGFLRGLFDKQIAQLYRRSETALPNSIDTISMCKPGMRRLFVESDGKYRPCEKIGKRLCLGNTNIGLDRIKSFSYYNEFVSFKNAICKKCWAVRLCDACAVTARSRFGVSAKSLKNSCQELKKNILMNLSIYSSIIKNDEQKNYCEYFDVIKIS